MGIGGIGIWQLLIILAIVIMLFGTKRLRTLGSDMGAAVKGFRSTMKTGDANAADSADPDPDSDQVEASVEAPVEESTAKK